MWQVDNTQLSLQPKQNKCKYTDQKWYANWANKQEKACNNVINFKAKNQHSLIKMILALHYYKNSLLEYLIFGALNGEGFSKPLIPGDFIW